MLPVLCKNYIIMHYLCLLFAYVNLFFVLRDVRGDLWNFSRSRVGYVVAFFVCVDIMKVVCD
jgi:hypothetical protein